MKKTPIHYVSYVITWEEPVKENLIEGTKEFDIRTDLGSTTMELGFNALDVRNKAAEDVGAEKITGFMVLGEIVFSSKEAYASFFSQPIVPVPSKLPAPPKGRTIKEGGKVQKPLSEN